MKTMLWPLVTATVSFALAGCTEIEVRKLANGPIEGIPYALPQKVFLISSVYELQGCSVDPPEKTGDKPVFRLSLAKTVTPVPSTEVDPAERYYIPYESVRNAFKDADITIESYENQTLKSLSSTVEDKAGETVTAAVGTVIKIAAIAAGVSAADVARHGPTPSQLRESYCGKDAAQALDTIKKLMARKVAKKPSASDAVGSAADNADIDDQIARVKQLHLVHKEMLRWVPGKGRPMAIEVYPQDFISKHTWVTTNGIDALKNSGGSAIDASGRIIRLKSEVALYTSMLPSNDLKESVPPKGFVVRSPALALLRVCDEGCPAAEEGDVSKVMFAAEHAVPQLGQYVIIPLKNRMFESQTISLALTTDGVLSKVGWKSSASGPAAVQALNTNLDAIAKAKTASDKAKADARAAAATKDRDHANAVKEDNNAVADCLKAQKAVADAGGTTTGHCQ